MWITRRIFRYLFDHTSPEVIADAFYRSAMLENDLTRQSKMRFIIHKLDTKLRIFYGEIPKKEPGHNHTARSSLDCSAGKV